MMRDAGPEHTRSKSVHALLVVSDGGILPLGGVDGSGLFANLHAASLWSGHYDQVHLFG